jgi:hypothetical protein
LEQVGDHRRAERLKTAAAVQCRDKIAYDVIHAHSHARERVRLALTRA